MKKIASLFQRNYDGDRNVRDEVVPGSEWVIAGEGVGTRKWDGMAVAVIDGLAYKRYDAKAGRTPPAGFKPAQPAPDPISQHWPGWVEIEQNDTRLIEGLVWGRKNLFGNDPVPDGTYEVCGPKIGTRHGANPEGLAEHILCAHGADTLPDCPRTYAELRDWLADRRIEGVVWHHEDGRMVKIKRADFGLKLATKGAENNNEGVK